VLGVPLEKLLLLQQQQLRCHTCYSGACGCDRWNDQLLVLLLLHLPLQKLPHSLLMQPAKPRLLLPLRWQGTLLLLLLAGCRCSFSLAHLLQQLQLLQAR
jgi:hypothetical protein